MNLTATREGIVIAIDALRSNKVRAFLTTLGIVIGVATVMTMAAAIGGFRGMIMETLDAIGPRNFVIDRFDQTKIEISDDGPPWEGKPAITFMEAEQIEALSSIRSVATANDAQGSNSIRAGSKELRSIPVMGRSAAWTDYSKGDFLQGRNYLPMDDERSGRSVVVSEHVAEELFEGQPAVGREVRINGEPFRVVGVYKMTDNPFAAAMKDWAVVPTTSALKYLQADPDFLSLLVVPEGNVTQEQAMDDVTALLRSMRGLRPVEENNFALMKQEQFKQFWDNLIVIFAVVMLILSGIGLLVGGVGVVGIMMITVTERTREIGVRKALGATPREILWQFLVESVTVTVIGGLIGILMASGFAMLITALTPVKATVPWWAIVGSVTVMGVGGILFGLYPAFKASKLDPVEALRYE
jgi:putative ABC transport system permease protein